MITCPGSDGIKGTPTLKVEVCPQCGKEIELFSSEFLRTCRCGFTAYNNIISCISWCQYAIECVGEETYNRIRAGVTSEKASNDE
jgi:hypothetical protein